MSRAENIHYTNKYKVKRDMPIYFAHKCRKPKCAICHPHKAIGGNNKAAIKPKYRIVLLDNI